jgi:uncharacterized protein (DUF4415 family)
MNNEATGNMPHTNLTDWDAVKALTDADIIHDDDSPATTEADWGQAFVSHSAIELHTEVARKACAANKKPRKQQVAVRYDADVLAAFRATGKGWQTRMNDALKEWLSEHKA